MLDSIEYSTGPNPTHAVIWLHGLGADGSDFAPIVPELVRSHWPSTRFVFPHAPVRRVTLNAGLPMRAWYDISAIDAHAAEDERGIRMSIAATDELLARERERGIPSDRTVLAGFSQGGAIALATGLRAETVLAGVVALSTYLPLRRTIPAELSAAGLATPIWFGHGRHDPVVPLPLGRMSHDLLRHHGAQPEWHEYPIEHTVSIEEIADLSQWLGSRLRASA